MIRSLHRDMIRNSADAYRETLAELSEGELKRANLEASKNHAFCCVI